MACGKRSYDKYGMKPIDRGFDESCMLNSVEAFEDEVIMVNDTAMGIKRKKRNEKSI